ncbi:MAG: tRNA (adenosine(37)-N6)-threonylcarbamoyltransferase complex dimerization subunit type 1 TsaB [Ktedonobacterales bacterium]|nr:tRNA (adenosine(37)-N6)-threonylcarbamoyltransferase complex dimerization subunit type 1 TsaB [Ktedonobacterales bacterium]
MLLAIDASTNWASLALLREGRPVATHHWAIGQQHSTQLFGGIDTLLAAADAPHGAVTAVAVATGPGSFNGTRVAVTAAKTLAFVWDVPLIGVPTLDGLAEDALRESDPALSLTPGDASILAVLEAGRDELYLCWYDLTRAGTAAVPHVQPRGPIIIAQVPDIVAPASDRSGSIVLCGEYSDAHAGALVAALGPERLTVHAGGAPDRAIGIGQLAWLRLAAGERDDPLALAPSYVRRPNITTSTRHPIPGPPERA